MKCGKALDVIPVSLDSRGMKAEKFQRLLLGGILLGAYIFESIPAVVFVVAAVVVGGLFSVKYTPFYRLYLWISPACAFPVENPPAAQSRMADKFAYLLAAGLLCGSLVLQTLYWEVGAWLIVLIVAVGMTMAGSVGFCLGLALFNLISRIGQSHDV